MSSVYQVVEDMLKLGAMVGHSLRDVALQAPEQPGVYLFLDSHGRVLYIGKAKDLRRRVLSYFAKEQTPKTARMLAQAKELRFVVTRTEVEALILENRLIKQNKPKYNVLLRDDKTYPYIKLTTSEWWPRAVLVRRVEKDKNEYYGPFLGRSTASRLMDLIRMYSQVRTCSWHLKPQGTLSRPCLYYDMGACLGPCVAGLTTVEAYKAAVEDVRLLLTGKTSELGPLLKQKMWAAAERQEYERAARYRDLAKAVASMREGQLAELPGRGSFDVHGLWSDGRDLTAVVLVYREGKLSDKREYHFEGINQEADEEFLGQFLPQFYEANPAVPEEVLLPYPCEEAATLAAFLTDKRGVQVRVVYPSRGEKQALVALARENAAESFRLRFRHPQREADLLTSEIQKTLGLHRTPNRIECFDVSHLGGEAAVVSVVVWEKGKLMKRDYRSFNVTSAQGGDDPASLAEGILRRYSRLLREGKPLPDLVVVDGGLTQLVAAFRCLDELKLDLPTVALAKRFEEIYLTPDRPPLRLPANSPVRLLLQRLRDEAHRFAVTRHRRRRRAKRLVTELLGLPGIGPARAKKLLQHFGSLEGVRRASLSELEKVVGPRLAQAVKESLGSPRESIP